MIDQKAVVVRPADDDLPAGKAQAAALVRRRSPDQHERDAPAVKGSAGADRVDAPRQEIAQILPVAGRGQEDQNGLKRCVLRRYILERIALRIRRSIANPNEDCASGKAGNVIDIGSRHLLERVRRQPPGEQTEQQDRKQQKNTLFRSQTHTQALRSCSACSLPDSFQLCKTSIPEEL